MKKLMIVQLGVILAFAASTTAFAGATEDKSDGASRDVLGGRKVENERVRGANIAVENSGANSTKEVNRGDEQEVRSSTTGKSDLERASVSFKNIVKLDVGAKYAKGVELIKNDPSLISDLERIDAIGRLIGKTREEILKNCENI